ncbi:MAG: PPK2 family polyphosphate kinase [Eubacteriales bacterium]|nr:PPK2 family polyphosphate kinase [Eubacteriales bacterium]
MPVRDCRYDGSRKLNIKAAPTGAGDEREHKQELEARTAENIARACQLQEMLMAEGREGLIVAIQARDAAGKDSLIKKVFSGLNPAGLTVHAFKAPTGTELAHDYLWRIMQAVPPRGQIGVFNRSHYEDVLVTRVHHLEKGYALPQRCLTEDFYQRRYAQLRAWEQYLYENGYRMIKLFLNVSKEEQRKRFLDRMELAEKHWKLSLADMKERAQWDEYDRAYEDAINATAAPESPWYVVPADNKWYTRYLVSQILVDTLEEMNPAYPPLDSAEAAKIPAAIAQLEREEYN